MKKIRISIFLTLLFIMSLKLIIAQELSLTKTVIEKELSNGLKVLLVNKPETPMVRCILAYRVGSVNERPGITGISHFFEHMMFKGTYSMGVKPGMIEKDLEYDRKIDAIMEKVVKEENKKKGRDEEKIKSWKAEVTSLINEQRKETIINNELWAAYQEAGGVGINASTSKEMTQYFVTLPKNRVELFLALEADRMQNSVLREFYSERDVIVEERRMSENGPGFFFNEQLNAAFYGASPYSWTVLGWMSDISRVTKKEMEDYRDLYYKPDNAVLVLAGDIDETKIMALVEKYFGKIESKVKTPVVRTEEPNTEYYKRTFGDNFPVPAIEKRVNGKAATSPSVRIMFHIPPIWHDDLPALTILGRIMSARTGEMYKTMVLEKEVASSVGAFASNSMYDGSFTVTAGIKEIRNKAVVTPDEIEKQLWDFIEKAKNTPFDNEIIQRIKNSVEASFLQSLTGTGIANSLARMEIAYKWQHLEDQYKMMMAVTADDLMRVAKRYLIRNHSVTGILERE